MNHYQTLIKLISSTVYRHSTWDVFRDFIEMSAISISNTVDWAQRNKRETQYLDIIKKYNEKEINQFPAMLAELVMALEEEPADILGRVYQELGLANKWTGQFFTPDSVARLMGQLLLTDDMRLMINEKGFITIQEPAIGGGALIINLALAMRDAGINYQQSMCVTGIDLDIKSIHMSYLQLSLLHIPAILVHGNSLSMEMHSKWYTPAYIMGGWAYRKQKEQIETKVIALQKHQKRKTEYDPISLFG